MHSLVGVTAFAMIVVRFFRLRHPSIVLSHVVTFFVARRQNVVGGSFVGEAMRVVFDFVSSFGFIVITVRRASSTIWVWEGYRVSA